MRNFFIRARTAILFAAIMIGGIFWNVYSYCFLMAAVIAFSLYEYFRIISYTREANRVSMIYMPMGVLTGLATFASSFLVLEEITQNIAYLVPTCILFTFFALEIFSESQRPLANIAQNITGVIYVSIPFAILNYVAISNKTYEPKLVAGILFLVWVNDAAAYIFGSLFGKHKFLERISPNKTIEGLFGGAFGCLLFAYLLWLVFGILGLRDWVAVSLIVWVFATSGDLIVSMFKRSVSIKDTGYFFPGHGGFLDRFDAFIFAVPFVAAYILYMR